MGIVIMPPRNSAPRSADSGDPIANDEAADQFAAHVYGVCERTIQKLVEHYRPFVKSYGYDEATVTKMVQATIGGAVLAIGIKLLKDSGFTTATLLEKMSRASIEDDEERAARQVSEKRGGE